MSQHGQLEERRLELSRMADGYRQASVLITAQHLGLFDVLSDGARMCDDLANELALDPRNLDLLLRALVGMDLLSVDNEHRFSLHGLAAEFLAPGAEYFMGDIIEHGYSLMKRWVRMEEVVRSGKPIPRETSGGRSPRELRAFIMGMQNISKLSAEEVADALDLRGVKRILDLGGGPGTYLYSILNRLPDASGAVLDLPDVVEIAQEQAEVEGVADRVDLIPGDMHSTHLGGPWDLIFIGNIIHSWGPETNQRLFQRCAEVLSETGRIAIKDFYLDETGTQPRSGALFSLNMMVNNAEGRSFKRVEVESWLRAAGLTPLGLHHVGTHSGVLVAGKG
ncbi:methyltransferase domain-containing protein [bacterium]|nr:methyltransferase domain-containing protein [bacterium]